MSEYLQPTGIQLEFDRSGLSISQHPSPEFTGLTVAEWNRSVIDQLYQIQESTEEGCFFTGLCALSNALYPDRPLPEAHSVWAQALRDYPHLLKPTTVLVAHNRLAQAFREIYPSWGIQLTEYSLNDNGNKYIGTDMMAAFGPPRQLLPTYFDLPTNSLKQPYGILMHQASENDAHFITIDGSAKAKHTQAYFQHMTLPYRIIATFSLQSIT